VLFVPMVVKTAGAAQAAEAQRILFEVRAPHHFVVSPHERDFLPFVGWCLIGIAAAGPLVRGASGRPIRLLVTFLTGLSIVIWLGVVLSVALEIGAVTQLFAWRLVPHAQLLLELLACVALSRVIAEPAVLRRYGVASAALLSAGVGLLLMFYANRNQAAVPAIVWSAVAALLLVMLLEGAVRLWAPRDLARRLGRAWNSVGSGILVVGMAALLYASSTESLRTFERRSTLIQGLGRAEAELFAWMRTQTPKDATFLTPPDIETARFHGQRAIVVDWKSNPAVPGEVLEWYRRLEDVTGRSPLRGEGDLRGYDSLDVRRLERLRTRYAIDYVVVRRGRERFLSGLRTVFRNGAFTVLDLHEEASSS
jgi:hypothetical protein